MMVFVDFNQMVQVFVNLFQNANQAMSDGGKLFITTHSENGDVDVEIEDTGEGIPQENMERIFAPFFTTRTEGTGLGLAVISRILEQHNAQISVESQIGIGTKFTVRLPAK
jgi:signal transduction histidine kinase